MKYIFTKHAKKQMQCREVTESEIIDCIEHPDRIEPSRGVFIAKKLKTRKKLLMVIFDEKKKKIITVITVIETNKINKYLK